MNEMVIDRGWLYFRAARIGGDLVMTRCYPDGTHQMIVLSGSDADAFRDWLAGRSGNVGMHIDAQGLLEAANAPPMPPVPSPRSVRGDQRGFIDSIKALQQWAREFGGRWGR